MVDVYEDNYNYYPNDPAIDLIQQQDYAQEQAEIIGQEEYRVDRDMDYMVNRNVGMDYAVDRNAEIYYEEDRRLQQD